MRTHLPVKLMIAMLFVACGGDDGPVLTDEDANGEHRFLDFRSPQLDIEMSQAIAMSARINVTVESKSRHCTGGCGDSADCHPRDVELVEVMSSDSTVLEVVEFEPGTLDEFQEPSLVTLRGAGEGSATLRVKARVSDGSGEPIEVEDTHTFDVAAADRFEFCPAAHCADSDEVVFLADQAIPMGWSYSGASQPLGGYGYYPVEVEPADGAAIDSDSEQMGFEVIGAASDTPVTIKSTLDEYSYSMRFVEQQQIDQLPLYPSYGLGDDSSEVLLDGDSTEAPAGNVLEFFVHPRYSGTQIYNPKVDLRVDSTDPTRCRFYSYGVDFEALPTQTDLLPAVRRFALATRGVGTCGVTVTHILPDGSTGAESTVEIELMPRE